MQVFPHKIELSAVYVTGRMQPTFTAGISIVKINEAVTKLISILVLRNTSSENVVSNLCFY